MVHYKQPRVAGLFDRSTLPHMYSVLEKDTQMVWGLRISRVANS